MSSREQFEQLFVTLKREIHEITQLLQSVQSFRSYIERGIKDGTFDAEDLTWVEEDIRQLETSKKQKEQELIEKEQIYTNSVLKLEEILDRRKNIIESAEEQTHALSLRPNLLQNFAKKRAQLMKLIDQGRRDLQKPK